MRNIFDHLGEKAVEIVLTITNNDRKTKYTIQKTTGISHTRVHDLVEYLQKIGALEGKEEGKTRTGLPKTSYALTLTGFCIAIKNCKVEDSITIARKWAHLDRLIAKTDEFLSVLGKEETQKFLTCYLPEALKSAEPEKRDLFTITFQDEAITKLLFCIRESMVQASASIAWSRRALEREGLYEPLMEEAKNIGFTPQSLDKANQIICHFYEIQNQEREGNHSLSKKIGYVKKTVFDPFSDKVSLFLIVLEGMVSLERDKGTLQKWIQLLVNDELLRNPLESFVTETSEVAAEQLRWSQAVQADMELLKNLPRS